MELGLVCLNKGTEPTCVRPQGSSIVDLTFGTPDMAVRIRTWMVLPTVTLSDHRYVHASLSETTTQQRRRAGPPERRWKVKALDEDLMRASLIASDMTWAGSPIEWDLEAEARRAKRILVRACDAAMPRTRPQSRRAMPWWSEHLAELRRDVFAARRALKRAQRRHRDDEEMRVRADTLREARRVLGAAISEAKARSWKEFVESLDDNPWGRPYLLVRDKLRYWVPPYTESLDAPVLEGVLRGLFPSADDEDSWAVPSAPPTGRNTWRESQVVTEEEMLSARRRMLERSAAPGESGVPARAWGIAIGVLGGARSLQSA